MFKPTTQTEEWQSVQYLTRATWTEKCINTPPGSFCSSLFRETTKCHTQTHTYAPFPIPTHASTLETRRTPETNGESQCHDDREIWHALFPRLRTYLFPRWRSSHYMFQHVDKANTRAEVRTSKRGGTSTLPGSAPDPVHRPAHRILPFPNLQDVQVQPLN